MLGGLGAYIASEVSGAVRRNVIVYGLYGFGALLVLCAGGYALNALHTVLLASYGAVAASLWIAGGLLLAGLISFGIALYVKSRPRPARPLAATALVAAPDRGQTARLETELADRGVGRRGRAGRHIGPAVLQWR
jgi:hypothetical protein